MSNPGEEDATPIVSVQQLAGYLSAGGKPRAAWRIGTEHEKFGFFREGGAHRAYAAPPYEPGGIRAMLQGIEGRGWEPILDQGNLIGLKKHGESVSLEPGGQFELSGAPVASLHDTTGWGWGSHRSDSIPRRAAKTCRSCRKAVTPSCGATCRWSVASAWT
jgi:glutamate--cysteine ligase